MLTVTPSFSAIMSNTEVQPAVSEQPNYIGLASFRLALRQFVAFSQQAAKDAGLPPQQHQTLLAIRGLGSEQGMTISEVAACMLLKHHTAVELADRLEKAGLVCRRTDAEDRRVTRLTLTQKAEEILAPLTLRHMAEVRKNAPNLITILQQISD